MQLTLQPKIPRLTVPIQYTDKILLIGSCFTEHMSGRLAQHKFKVMQNPHGILFNPLSVANSMQQYLEGNYVSEGSLFFLNETWNSWDHHSQFSGTDKQLVIEDINTQQQEAHAFIQDVDWVIITLGSSYQYYLKQNGKPVANNHRAPAQWFERKLLGIDEIILSLTDAIKNLRAINPKANILFTISPVRHIRDGVVENNRSKARLIEAVHSLCELQHNCHYFPAYELVIDILRDYRFYDIDFVHPNYLATSFVWEEFLKACIATEALPIMEQVKDIMTAKSHRARFSDTDSHKTFLKSYVLKTRQLMEAYPFLDLNEELDYFMR